MSSSGTNITTVSREEEGREVTAQANIHFSATETTTQEDPVEDKRWDPDYVSRVTNICTKGSTLDERNPHTQQVARMYDPLVAAQAWHRARQHAADARVASLLSADNSRGHLNGVSDDSHLAIPLLIGRHLHTHTDRLAAESWSYESRMSPVSRAGRGPTLRREEKKGVDTRDGSVRSGDEKRARCGEQWRGVKEEGGDEEWRGGETRSPKMCS